MKEYLIKLISYPRNKSEINQKLRVLNTTSKPLNLVKLLIKPGNLDELFKLIAFSTHRALFLGIYCSVCLLLKTVTKSGDFSIKMIRKQAELWESGRNHSGG